MYSDKLSIGMRQVERYMIAAQQDAHPSIMMLHANYAVGILDAIRQAWSDAEIQQETGYDPKDLHTKAIALQDAAQKKLAFLCPHLVPST